ncbi:probable NADH-cytochrome b5 reductase 1 [Saccharomycodes ludwigii]|uniref:NADH-cytochrome b5 reductase n=1 Tax=Saccharomycodes ludwigii TaxID=36035 RepID=A0A376B5P3_9ASCO|nr:hypothetical protein SCDLUD_000365 [Saccharomycodes ludwigii]KAH3902776.1 hypothetical protein SCDLUD_000365 [Saccharomycodes ludwigii]SSD59889.1 probable NADH-cytochrome b5 reductase 1 [Saccharomycodes ludwigii]
MTNNISTTVLAAIIITIVIGVITINKTTNPSKTHRTVLIKDEFQEFPLISKTVLSHNTAIYRFKLPNETDRLGLPIGQHISISGVDYTTGKSIMRSYTPTSLDSESSGFFELLIKAYENGNISKMFANLSIGDKIKARGPKGFYTYKPNMRKHLAMVCGGTGITPMYQILKSISHNSRDNTKVTLIYGNVSESDILLKNEIDEIINSGKNGQFKVYYMLDKAPEKNPESWEGGIGYITKEIMEEHLPKATDDGVQLLVCGPPGLVSSVKRNSLALGFEKAKALSKGDDQVFVF